ncbi:ATP-binding protein [Leptonema illini]|uniref:ATP-binding region ATPase domain protein n=1 Tax=Leptonema illini DSM 21528 TaxID=929563 RepID=H2CH02_9LEPT|nr:ATP-binding protein [Leptonema illini]EHQ05844.1 ATP-binding region ATPase domain protein [Leptonema illini DSM 21528]
MKTEKGFIDASPSKRIFKSIIADYDLKQALCELIDNAIDQWVKSGKQKNLSVCIELNLDQQTIQVSDNAGGIKESELSYIVGPGQTSSTSAKGSIGIFGVGSKRAVVAIAQEIKIASRYEKKKTFHVELNDDWLNEDSWQLPYYEINDIEPKTTTIDLSRLRNPLTLERIEKVIEELQATYGYFILHKNFSLIINQTKLKPLIFNNSWSYNPDYKPQVIKTKIPVENDIVEVKFEGGLITDGGSAGHGEYGVYFYCNERLVSRAEKSYEVGFTSGKAGVPHGASSLSRLIVNFYGKPSLLPWNSSKSGIDYKHKVYEAARNEIINMLSYYTSLCRRLYPEADNAIYPFTEGKPERKTVPSLAQVRKIYDIPLPPSRPREDDIIKKKNEKIGKEKPWTVGLYETVMAVSTISKNKKLTQRNRINLLLLDSGLEIGFKEFLMHDSDSPLSEEKLAQIFKNRINVHQEVKKRTEKTPREIKRTDWGKIKYYYDKRCDLVHKKSTNAPTDDELEDFRELTERIFGKLFGLTF